MGEEDDFVEFYKNFPRREARADALKAWRQTVKQRPPLQDLLAAVVRQRIEHDWCRERRRFIPLPATWLRGQRWADDFDVPESVLPSKPAATAPGISAGERATNEAALAAWNEVRATNSAGQSRPLLGWSDARTGEALRVMGSALADMGPRNAHLVQRDFVAAFKSARLPAVVTDRSNVVPMRRRA